MNSSGLVGKAVLSTHVVVEVLTPSSHPTDVESSHGTAKVAVLRRIVADGHQTTGHYIKLAKSRLPAGLASSHSVTPHLAHAFGVDEERQPAVARGGRLLHTALTEGSDVDRDLGPLQVVDDLQWLAQPGALVGWKGEGEHVTVVDDPFPAPR